MTTEAPRRGVGSVLDMVRSLALVLLAVGVVALITLRPGGSGGPRVIEYGVELAAARAAAPYEVLAPSGLDGYLATSVRYDRTVNDGTVWHLGFVTPADRYVGVDQTDGPSEKFVNGLTEGASALADGTVALGARTWQRYDGGGDSDDELVRALVNDEAGVTTVVSGTAEWAELEAMAASLR